MTKLKAAIAAILALALGAAWYFGSPRWTLHQMQSAAEAKDADRLSAYIDYPNLRASLKEQMKAKVAMEVAKTQEDNPFGALGAAIALNMVDGMVEGLVTPTTMREVFANAPEPKPDEGKMGIRLKNLDMERHGLSEFELVNRDDKTGSSIIFKRDGLGWKMSEIRMPVE